ncbi:DUF72 domain-containing protein [Robbsia sp. Bb-Pol-6]|uniref:DUF72 domain-containing protein n=1 Tax=Robbsia betulipollinis TaxID=2981849 RepID=A0ABT3ZMA7_9BURK|nr:DUF72 domain-containing protein [Robbsia betulipollinis]MCY0387669.1 DUF72 domain-containing protein [Robbsia betulipollinis]
MAEQEDLFGHAPAPTDDGAAHARPQAPRRSRRVAQDDVPCRPPDAVPEFFARAGAALPAGVHLGTSSWSFPGWRGLLYQDTYTASALAHTGLAAYAASPLLRCVGIDRSFYAPLAADEYARYAAQVADDFRFVVKAPARVCDGAIRGTGGAPARVNPDFLDPAVAIGDFIQPCVDGLGAKIGALVFQLSPLPDALAADLPAVIDRLGRFFDALPPAPHRYALEIRDPALLTPRLIRMLREHGVRYCIGIHSRMPDAARQATALDHLDDGHPGPLIVRWSLHAGMRYEGARTRYEPFDAIVDPDLPTRTALAALAARAVRAGQPAYVIVNNKAEGSSPLSCAWLALAIAEAMRAR